MTAFPLRLPDQVMEQARVQANASHTSLNQLFLAYIAEGIGRARVLSDLKQRAEKANIGEVLALLDHASEIEPEDWDKLNSDQGSHLRM